jgi:hypothetical protein
MGLQCDQNLISNSNFKPSLLKKINAFSAESIDFSRGFFSPESEMGSA